MNEILTRGEIEKQFENEWILLADPEVDEHLNVIRGTVLAHSHDRDEVYRSALDLRPKHSAFLYTGEIPDDVVIVI